MKNRYAIVIDQATTGSIPSAFLLHRERKIILAKKAVHGIHINALLNEIVSQINCAHPFHAIDGNTIRTFLVRKQLRRAAQLNPYHTYEDSDLQALTIEPPNWGRFPEGKTAFNLFHPYINDFHINNADLSDLLCGVAKITFRQSPFASLNLPAKLVGKATRRTIGTVKFRLNFNISRDSGEVSGKLRRNFALPSLYLRSEGGKMAKQGWVTM